MVSPEASVWYQIWGTQVKDFPRLSRIFPDEGRGWRSQVGPDLLAIPLLRAAVFLPRETDVGACAQACRAIVDLLATQASWTPARLRQQVESAKRATPVGAERADASAIDISWRVGCLVVGLGCRSMQKSCSDVEKVTGEAIFASPHPLPSGASASGVQHGISSSSARCVTMPAHDYACARDYARDYDRARDYALHVTMPARDYACARARRRRRRRLRATTAAAAAAAAVAGAAGAVGRGLS